MQVQQTIKAEREEGKLPEVYRNIDLSSTRTRFTGSKYDIDYEGLEATKKEKLVASNLCETQRTLF
jgi:hypothetical protein